MPGFFIILTDSLYVIVCHILSITCNLCHSVMYSANKQTSKQTSKQAKIYCIYTHTTITEQYFDG